MTKGQIMQRLWKLSEKSDDPKEKLLLEIAGNMVEATFVSTETDEAISLAINDAKENIDG